VNIERFHPFQAANNVNRIDAGAIGYYTLDKTVMGLQVLEFPEAYLR
jgi:hypothetical protein